jgi:hypothetical protein
VTPNQRLIDRLIRHKVYALGYAKHVADRVIAFLDATEPAMRRELLDIFGTNTTGQGTIKRLRRAELLLSRIRGTGWSRATGEAMQLIADLARGEPEHLSQAVGQKLKLPTESILLRKARATLIAGHKLLDWLNNMRLSDIRRLIGQLRVAVFGGETVPQMLKRITGKLSAIANTAKNSIRAIVNTAVGAVVNTVRRAIIDLNPGPWGFELWVSVLDSRTTVTCRALDGQVFAAGEGIQPGYHINCRSERIPLLDDGGAHELGNYSAWIGTQAPEFQRYAGTQVFSVTDLRPLSLDKMRALDK